MPITVGVVESARIDGGTVVASGYLNETLAGDEVAVKVASGELRPALDLGETKWIVTGADGNELNEESYFDLPLGPISRKCLAGEFRGVTLTASPAWPTTPNMVLVDS